MMNILETIWLLVGLSCALSFAAGIITFAVATVCQWMKWSPINVTINIYKDRDAPNG